MQEDKNELPLTALPLLRCPMGEWVDVATRLVQVKLELQYFVLNVIWRSVWIVEVNDMAEHKQPREFVKPTQYLLN